MVHLKRERGHSYCFRSWGMLKYYVIPLQERPIEILRGARDGCDEKDRAALPQETGGTADNIPAGQRLRPGIQYFTGFDHAGTGGRDGAGAQGEPGGIR